MRNSNSDFINPSPLSPFVGLTSPSSPSQLPQAPGLHRIGTRRPSSAATIRRPQAVRHFLLDDELSAMASMAAEPPPMATISLEQATPLERSFSAVLGMTKQGRALKLPQDVEICPRGNRCCWRWLARGVVEQVSSGTTNGQGLTEAISSLSQELTKSRTDAKDYLEAKIQCENETRSFRQLHEKQREMDYELQDLRCVREKLDVAKQENDSMRTAMDKYASTERGLEKVVSCLQAQHRVLIDGDVAAMRQRADTSERLLRESEKMREDLVKRCARAEAELQAQKTANAVLMRSAAEVKSPKVRRQVAKTKPAPQRRPSSAASTPVSRSRRPSVPIRIDNQGTEFLLKVPH